MNREDLGKMLERNLGWPVLSGGGDAAYQKIVDDELQWGAEGFWDDVIDALKKRCGDLDVDDDGVGYPLSWWLEYQKITED